MSGMLKRRGWVVVVVVGVVGVGGGGGGGGGGGLLPEAWSTDLELPAS